MATWIWSGDMAAVAQVSEVEIDGYDGATTYGITINGKTVSLLGDTDAATTIAALIVLLNASEEPEFAEITWAEGSTSTHVKGTADTAGKPYAATAYTSGGAGTMDPTNGNALTAVTANAGPNVCCAENFKTDANVRGVSGGTEVANDDTVIYRDSDTDCKYGLDYMKSVTLAALHFEASYTGSVGLPEQNEDATAYGEYRQRALQFGSNSLAIRIGEGEGNGSPKLRLEPYNGTTIASLTVFDTGSSEDNEPAVEIVADANTFTLISITGGTVGFVDPVGGGADTLTALNIGGEAEVTVEAGTLTAVTMVGSGILNNDNAITTLDIYDSAIVNHVTGNITTVNVRGGSLNVAAKAALTITTANMGPDGTISVNESTAVVTITTLSPEPGCTITATNGLIAITNAIDLGDASLEDFNFDFGPGHDYTLS